VATPPDKRRHCWEVTRSHLKADCISGVDARGQDSKTPLLESTSFTHDLARSSPTKDVARSSDAAHHFPPKPELPGRQSGHESIFRDHIWKKGADPKARPKKHF